MFRSRSISKHSVEAGPSNRRARKKGRIRGTKVAHKGRLAIWTGISSTLRKRRSQAVREALRKIPPEVFFDAAHAVGHTPPQRSWTQTSANVMPSTGALALDPAPIAIRTFGP